VRVDPPRYRTLTGASTPADVAAVLDWLGVDEDTPHRAEVSEGLKVALVHDSYLHEHPDELPFTNAAVLRLLEALGAGWVRRELALRFYLDEEYDTVGLLSDRLAASSTAFEDWAVSLDWTQTAGCYGRGEASRGGVRSIRARLTNQVLGLLAAHSADRVLRSATAPLVRAVLAQSPTASDPRTVLGRIVPDADQSWTLTPSGPDHDRVFSAVLEVRGRAPVTGTGSTKKLARAEAARVFLQSYAPGALVRSKRPPSAAMPDKMPLPTRVTRSVDALLDQFGLESRFGPFITQAFIHTSWVHENRDSVARHRQRDNQLLAFVGAAVLHYEHVQSVAPPVLTSAPEGFALMTLTDRENADAFQAVGMTDAALLGRGQTSLGMTVEIASNMFQALAAALYIAAGAPDRLFERAPDSWSEAARLIAPDSMRSQDPTTLAGARLGGAGLDVQYAFETCGPDHAKSYSGSATISSRKLGTGVAIAGESARSKTAAKHQVAQHIVDSFDLPETGVLDAPAPTLKLAGFFLRHLICRAQENPQLSSRWCRAKLLGAHLASQPAELVAWAERADAIILACGGLQIGSGKLSEFYHRAMLVGSGSGSGPITELASTLDLITSGTEESLLSPSLNDRLVSLCAAFRAMGRQDEDEDLEVVLRGWEQLHREVHLSGTTPELTLVSGERVALDYVVDTVCRGASSVEVAGDREASRISIRPDPPSDAFLTEAIAPFRSVSPRLTFSVRDGSVHAAFTLPGTREESSLVAAVQGAMVPRPNAMNEAVANLLHDMKNQLVAARQAGRAEDESRTARLEAQLAASRHVDQARVLARYLEAQSSLLGASDTTSTEVGAYLRRYAASLLLRLPSHIAVVAPTGVGPAAIGCDEASLGAILANLTSNAVEAMPDGGTLELEWLSDDDEVLLTVRDSGSGIPREVLTALMGGGHVRSTNPNGNGLGLVGVQGLVRRMGGKLESLDTAVGTCWAVSLPRVDNLRLEGEL